MKNIQNHLDEKFSKNKEEIKMTVDEMEGDLIIKDYSNLKTIQISNIGSPSFEKGKIPKVTLENLPKLEEVIILCCEMEKLEVNNCPLINSLRLRKNKLHNLNFLNLLSNPENLTYLSISNNRIMGQDLSDFSKFINLETLTIGNESEKGGNNFHGSLIHLKDLNQLKTLDISYTNVDANELDSLSLSLERIICQSNKDNNHNCYQIEQKLKEGWRNALLKIENNRESFSIESETIKKIEQEFDDFMSNLNSKYDQKKIKEVITRKVYQSLNKNQLTNIENEAGMAVETTNSRTDLIINGSSSVANWVSAIATVIGLFVKN
ncbi:MAG: hypothetical protein LBR43_02435 [Spiroplasmataceae bacterium]|nr:hypothetical protein [Spiroplasmataceae bacterium]